MKHSFLLGNNSGVIRVIGVIDKLWVLVLPILGATTPKFSMSVIHLELLLVLSKEEYVQENEL